MIICPVCENENEFGAIHCILCGAELVQASPEESLIQPPLESNQEDLSKPPPEVPLLDQTLIEKVHNQASTLAPPIFQQIEELDPEGNLLTGGYTPPSSENLPSEASTFQRDPTIEQSTYPLSQIPAPGTLCLIVYFKRKPARYFPITYDELLIGRTDPASNAFPDLDMTPYDPELAISRKHAYLYKEGDNYYIYPISNSGTQVNQEMVDIGVKKLLTEGDIIILSGRLAIRFAKS